MSPQQDSQSNPAPPTTSRRPVVIITGASSGIGLQLSIQLSQKHYIVIATLRNPSEADPSLRATSCDIQPLDVSVDDSVTKLASHVENEYQACDIVINNAGFGIPGCLEAMSIDDAKRVYEVNVWGVMRMCQTFSPQMRKRGGGLVLVVSSTSGIRGLPCSDIYASSKQAVEGLMDSYRYSVEQDNIKVAIINPGPVDTKFSSRYRAEDSASTKNTDPYPDMTAHYTKWLTMRNRTGQPASECAASIVETMEREFPKKVDDGTENVRFWNPTSEYGVRTVNDLLGHPDGHSGQYKIIFDNAREVANMVKKGRTPSDMAF